MKIILAAINAKHIHSNPAVYSLKAYADKFCNEDIIIKEFTINQQEKLILSEIYNENADMICFSCYIWNFKYVLNISHSLKKISPEIIIVFGGPEVSYENEGLLGNPADIIISGEGEDAFLQMCKKLPITPCVITGKALPLDDIPFVYQDKLELFHHRIIYYETSRGCPFECKYCLSSVNHGVRFLGEERVESDLGYFIKNSVKQVKFVDRTFNCNKRHAHMIWKYILENDNGVTNFHFEINGDLITDEDIEILAHARSGLFQFEIGIQSTHGETLNAINRPMKPDLFDWIQKIIRMGTINVHLDLIVGLPHEDYACFKNSFNDVYSLNPHQLQVGFLKLLKGSMLKEESMTHDIVYSSEPPYEVLKTNDLTYSDINRLNHIEEIIDMFYNSHKFLHSLKYIEKAFNTPFDFYENFAEHWHKMGFHLVSHAKLTLYEILYRFACPYVDTELLKELIKFDILLCDNIKTLPEWLGNETDDYIKIFLSDDEIRNKYLPDIQSSGYSKTIKKYTTIKFTYDVINDLKKKDKYIFINYDKSFDIPGIKTFHGEYTDITDAINEIKRTEVKK